RGGDSDNGIADEDEKKFEMALGEGSVVIGKNGHGDDGTVVGDKRNAAETAAGANGFDAELSYVGNIVLADQDGLARSNEVLGEMVSGRARAPGHAVATDDFQIKTQFVAEGIQLGDIKVFDIKEPAQFFP